jgi:hypothetical protein
VSSVSTSPINSAVGSGPLLVTVEEVSRDIFGGICGLVLSFGGWSLLLTAVSCPCTGSLVIDIVRENSVRRIIGENVGMSWCLKD